MTVADIIEIRCDHHNCTRELHQAKMDNIPRKKQVNLMLRGYEWAEEMGRHFCKRHKTKNWSRGLPYHLLVGNEED